MDVSIYIPVVDSCDKLYDIISTYNSSSIKPKEIIVNAFGVDNQKSVNSLKRIYDLRYDNVYIYVKKVYGTESENRNHAYRLTRGDIISFHDCSKLPSVNRVDILSKYFESGNLSCIHHTSHTKDISNNINDNYIIDTKQLYSRYFPFNIRQDCWQYTRNYGQEFSIKNIDMGSVSVLRSVLIKNKWKEPYQCELYRGNGCGTYYEFALENLYTYRESIIIDTPLTIV